MKFFLHILCAVAFVVVSGLSEATAKTRVEVIDSVSGKGVPFVAVFVEGTGKGVLTDENGVADIFVSVPSDSMTLRFSVMGYDKKTLTIAASSNRVKARLMPSGVQLSELTVKGKRGKYSKKNNPALDFVVKIRNGADATDPRLLHDNYNYNRYERITLGLNKFDPENYNKGLLAGKFDFLKQHVDTSEVSGTPVLIVSVKEKASEINYRANPKAEKETVTAVRRQGLDDITDEESVQVFLEDIMREIDLYDNDINLLQNRFVSPLSRIAPDFYKFFLTDTVDIDGEQCVELSFTPHNRAMFGFTGHVYVPLADTTMFIKRVDMHLPPGINLNFIDRLYLRQDYERAPDGSRLKVRDDMTAEISVLPGVQGLYARRNTRYGNHNFEPAADPGVFGHSERVIVGENAYSRDDTYWAGAGFAPATSNEKRIGDFINNMRSVPLYYWSEKILKVLVSGYVPTDVDIKKSKFDIGPMNTLVSGNEIEGTRLRLGGMTTANLSPRWFARGYAAYGTKDRVWKYSGEVEYSFHDKRYHPREFPVHSLRASYLYDVDQIGQHYLFTNMDNFVLSLKRMDDLLMTYHRVGKLEYMLELKNGFSVSVSLKNERQEATHYVPFVNCRGVSASHYQETTASVSLRFAPGEKFYQTRSMRIPVNLDAPVILLTHTYGPEKFLGNTFAINKTELSVQKRFWFSAFGYTDIILKGGHVWEKAPFPDLLIPNANLSYTIQPESFALMNPMEFINDSYVSWDLTYWANGAIFNYIPLFKRLKLREVFCFRGVSGVLSDRNNPDLNPDLYRFPVDGNTVNMNWKPYMEVSAGIDNILKCIRLDYVWRISYRNLPNIDRRGLRIAMHITF